MFDDSFSDLSSNPMDDYVDYCASLHPQHPDDFIGPLPMWDDFFSL